MFEENYDHTNFNALADKLLNNTILCVKNKRFRLCEIEMYYKNDAHPDHYVHSDPDQKTKGNFYFHKYKNGTFKSGTFKGVDITFGNDNTYFGVLIRSIQNIDTNEFTEGSCNCVTKILSVFNVKDVKELFNIHYPDKNIINITDSELYLKMDDNLDREIVYNGPRIGLSDKFLNYRDLEYRFAIKIKNIKKKRKTFKIVR